MVAFCAIASSPAWHRRCRKHRSSARRRLRQGSSTRRDRKFLLAHHATPPSQALALMAWRGSTGKGAGSKGDNGPSKGSGKWQYWQGSWSPSTHNKGAPWKKNHGKAQEGKASLSFPGYDVAKKEEQPISEVATIKERDGDSYATALQRAINHVRKAEARTRKALADKKPRTVQWNNWVAELKRTFAKEKGRYQTAVSRLEREMEEALVEQECARAGLRRVAASMEVDTGPVLPENVDAGAEFEALMQDGIGLEEPQESNEDILKRTLQRGDGKREMAVTRTPETEVVTTPPPKRSLAYSLEVSTPLRERPTQLPREVQPLQTSVASASPGQVPAGSDPYMVSPSTTSRRSSPATSTRKKISTPDGNGREGVKAAVRPVAPKHDPGFAISRRQAGGELLWLWRGRTFGARMLQGSFMPLPQKLRRFLLLSLGSHHRHFLSTTSSTTTRRRESHQNQIWKPGTMAIVGRKTSRPWSDQGTFSSGSSFHWNRAATGFCLLWGGRSERLQQFSKRARNVSQSCTACVSGLRDRPKRYDRRRGGRVSGAIWLTELGHVPTEPSMLSTPAQGDFLFRCGRRRGGWVPGARRLTGPGHVPTEPSPTCPLFTAELSGNMPYSLI